MQRALIVGSVHARTADSCTVRGFWGHGALAIRWEPGKKHVSAKTIAKVFLQLSELSGVQVPGLKKLA